MLLVSSVPWALSWLGPISRWQQFAGGDLAGHIHQPPARGPGRPPQPLKGRLGVQALAAHHHPLGLLDQPPMRQSSLQLVASRPLTWAVTAAVSRLAASPA